MGQNGIKTIEDGSKLLEKKGVLAHYQVGLEKESLRLTKDLKLATHPHPSFLGSPLFNPYFTLDFASSQLEWTTPTESSFTKALYTLEQAQRFCLTHPSTESVAAFWPFSMPMHFNKCPQLADFGTSRAAIEKTLYRRGLCHRYGSFVQTICGSHFNLSFSKELFSVLHTQTKSSLSLEEFTSSRYLHICRNYLRFGWFITYLFGASPLTNTPLPVTTPMHGAHAAKHATSLRMSQFGYYSRIQSQMSISYNSLSAYLRDINTYLQKPRKEYKRKQFDAKGQPLMLSSAYLQIPNEHYARIRPKSSEMRFEGGQLFIDNIDYLEIRSLDLNPLNPLSIDKMTCDFLHLFLLMCLLHPSPAMTQRQAKKLTAEQNLIALSGRKTDQIGCCWRGLTIEENGLLLCSLLEPIAKRLDSATRSKAYTHALTWAKKAVLTPSLTRSGQVMEQFDKEGNFTRFTKKLVKEQHDFFHGKSLPKTFYNLFEEASKTSKQEQIRIEQLEQALLTGYEDLELSTQVLIRAAKKQGISISVIDPDTNLIELKKGKHTKLVKQATITDDDSYLTYELMKNKQLSKHFLAKQGVMTPQGVAVSSELKAFEAYEDLSDKPCVIKPLHTNYGIGIHFIDKGDNASAKKAIKHCLTLDSHVMVETYQEGKEYRFLVIDNKVISVIYRDAANVIGDGKKSIAELIKEKNEDPHYYRAPYFLQLSSEEKAYLAKQRLTPKSVPKKGHKVYLRENSNVSTGGDAIEVSHEVPSYFHKTALASAKSCKAKLCGVDMIIPSFKGKAYSVLEINYNPAIFFHARPFKGEAKDPGGAILKLLGF